VKNSLFDEYKELITPYIFQLKYAKNPVWVCTGSGYGSASQMGVGMHHNWASYHYIYYQ